MSDFMSAVFYMPPGIRERLLELFRNRPELLKEIEARFARKRDAFARGDLAEIQRLIQEEKGRARRFFDDAVAGKPMPGLAI